MSELVPKTNFDKKHCSDNGEGSPYRMVQFTDCHLGAVPGETLLNLNTDESFFDVLQLMDTREKAIDLLVCSGDIASAGNPDCYDRFYNSLATQFQSPLAWLPGNHDCAANMDAFAADKPILSRLVETPNWQIILLDSAVPGHVYGHLADSEFKRLQALLTTNAQSAEPKHVLVMLHHQPQPVGSAWIDQYTLRNADDFYALLDTDSNVKCVAWGHVHQAYSAMRNDILLCSAPSTCIQFKPDLDDFTVDDKMPGYRWFDLCDDGTIETGVERLDQKDYPIDFSSNGY